MFKNYLLTAWRALVKQKLHSALNIVGLAVGLAASIMMWLFAQDEMSYDKFQPNVEQSYRIAINYPDMELGADGLALTGGKIRSLLETEYNQYVDKATLIASNSSYWELYQDNEKLSGLSLNAADANIDQFFKFEILFGSGTQALGQPDQLLLSRSQALRIFGRENAVGQTLKMNNKVPLTIAGIFADLPVNSHLELDALYSVATLRQDSPNLFSSLEKNFFYNYIQLKAGVNPQDLADQLGQRMTQASGTNTEILIQPITDIHLHSALLAEMKTNGSFQTVQLALILSLFILLVACFNFINMATARSSLRAKEVGVRKALGASRGQLIQQFLTEAVMIVFIATVFALILVELLLPWFNGFTGKTISLNFGWAELGSLLALIMVIGVLAGAYPALFISSFNTLRVLSGDLNRGKSSILFRKVLVCVQSGIAVVLIIMTSAVYQQISFLKAMPLGYEREQVLVMPELKSKELRQGFDAFEKQLRDIDGVMSVTSGEQVPTKSYNMLPPVTLPHNGEELGMVPMIGVNYQYVTTLGFELLAGRDFTREHRGDLYLKNKALNSATAGVIINQTAMKAAGWQTPAQAIGQAWNWSDGSLISGTIVGVIKDVRFVSAHDPIQPMFLVLGLHTQGRDLLVVKYDSTNNHLIKSQINQVFSSLFSTELVDSSYLSTNFDALYVKEDKQTTLLLNFTLLIILITCVGLLGLASFTAERRRKEVALRKILGASTGQLVLMLTNEFSKLVLMANIIAWPVAYVGVNYWLEGFSVHIELQWWLFVSASVITLVISWLTVAGLSFKAAIARPVSSLRYE